MNPIRFFRLAVVVAGLWCGGAVLAQTATLTAPATTLSAAGGSVTFTVAISYAGQALTQLGGSLKVPSGWSLASGGVGGANPPGVTPVAGDTTSLDFAYISIPADGATLTLKVNYAAGLTGSQSIGGVINFKIAGSGSSQSITLSPVVFTLLTPTALSASQAIASKTLTATAATATFTPVTAANGTPPYTFAVSPALPTGLALNTSTGAISGTPGLVSAATSYTVTIRDGANATASSTFSLTVNPVLSTTTTVVGSGSIVGADIVHPNGNHYDQVLLTGASASVTAGPGKVTRTSFIDLNDDIVQVEFSGAGVLTLTLDNFSGPAAPVNYNQPDVIYMKGHATLAITGADDTSNVTVFSVGRMTAFDPTGAFGILQGISAANNPANNGSALFQGHAATAYDGVADIGLITIASTNGKFGGVRAADAGFVGVAGQVGIYAPGVAMLGPVFVGDITADLNATGTLVFGSTTEVRITGGDLLQSNGRAIQVDGIAHVAFTDGIKSGGQTLPMQVNRGRFEKNGVDVTNQLVTP